MNLDEIHEIELDVSIFGSAKINIRRQDGYIIQTIKPKWINHQEVFETIYKKWISHLSKKYITITRST